MNTLRLLPALLLLAACTQQTADTPPASASAQAAPVQAAAKPAQTPAPAAILPHGSGTIEKTDIPELMIDGASRNSLTLVYDPQGRPEKLEYGYGSNYRVHHYQYLYRDGRPSSALAETRYYRPDGSPDPAKTRSQHILFDDQGGIAVNDPGNPPPERPIDPAKWQTETRLMGDIAAKYAAKQ